MSVNTGNTETLRTAGEKKCTACGIDVSRAQRMKDSHGRYWCVACGQADQIKRAGSSKTAVGAICADCKSPTDAKSMLKLGDRYVCPGCYRVLTGKRDVKPAKSDSQDKYRVAKLVAGSVMLLAGFGLIAAHAMGVL